MEKIFSQVNISKDKNMSDNKINSVKDINASNINEFSLFGKDDRGVYLKYIGRIGNEDKTTYGKQFRISEKNYNIYMDENKKLTKRDHKKKIKRERKNKLNDQIAELSKRLDIPPPGKSNKKISELKNILNDLQIRLDNKIKALTIKYDRLKNKVDKNNIDHMKRMEENETFTYEEIDINVKIMFSISQDYNEIRTVKFFDILNIREINYNVIHENIRVACKLYMANIWGDNTSRLIGRYSDNISRTNDEYELLLIKNDIDKCNGKKFNIVHKMSPVDMEYVIINTDIRFINNGSKSKSIIHMPLYGVEYNIKNFAFGTNLIKNAWIEGNCVINYLKKILTKRSKANMEAIENLGGIDNNNNRFVTPEQLLEMCKKFDLKMICYDIKGYKHLENIPSENNKKHCKRILFIAYNNHFYPLKNEYLKTTNVLNKIKFDDAIYINDAKQEIIKLYNNGIVPSNITFSDNSNDDRDAFKISSFVNDGKLYVANDHYHDVKLLSDIFGVTDKLKPTSKASTLFNVLEKAFIPYSTYNYKSYFPHGSKFRHSALLYTKNNFNIRNFDDNNMITMDKNKCFGTAAASLPHLLSIDCRLHNFENNFDDSYIINENYLYVVEFINVKKLNLKKKFLISGSNCYDGLSLKILKDVVKIDFKIIEGIRGKTTHGNHFKELLTKLYNIDDQRNSNNEKKYNFKNDKFIKNMVNFHLGTIEKTNMRDTKRKTLNIVNGDEKDRHEAFNFKLSDDMFLLYEKSEKYNLYNCIPVKIQIMCRYKYIMYEMMNKLNIDDEDIINISTDAITILNMNNKYEINNEIINRGIKNKFEGWEIINNPDTFKKYNNPMINNNIFKLSDMPKLCNTTNNKLCVSPAGSGKTYEIMKLLKVYDEKKKDNQLFNYSIITPTHDTAQDYRVKNYECDVFHKFSVFGTETLPENNKVICDEVGLFNIQGWDLLLKCVLNGKTIECWGDFEQMLPVLCNSTFTNKSFLNSIFGSFELLDRNMRNTFSKEYYKQLQTTTDKQFLIDEVMKHSTSSYHEAEIIICYKISTRNDYNNMMLEYHGFKNMISKGVKIILKANNFRGHNIYNKHEFIIKKIKGDICTISDNINEYEFTTEIIKKYFCPGYAKTVYGTQGKSVKSYYYAPEDENFINNRSAYTIISRLKEDDKIVEENNKRLMAENKSTKIINENDIINLIDNNIDIDEEIDENDEMEINNFLDIDF